MNKPLKSFNPAIAAVPFKSPFFPKNPKILGVQEGYDLWAEIYDLETNVLIQLEERYLFERLKTKEYREIFDCGCGTGRIALQLRQFYPESTISGVDFSQGMLKKAREKGKGKNINWHTADLNHNFPFQENHFDLIVSSLVIEHIADLDNFFKGIKKVARPGADIYITGLHPLMHVFGITARFKSNDEEAEIIPESRCHRLSDIFNAATKAGLKFSELIEGSVDESLIEACPKAKRYEGMMLLFIMKLEG